MPEGGDGNKEWLQMGISLESEKNTQKLDCCYHTTVNLLKIIESYT